jgi:sec-independent protein translocase protein TatA
MFGIGTSELLIILLIVVVLFGASRLPELGRGLGQGMRSFKDALKGTTPESREQQQQPTEQKKS